MKLYIAGPMRGKLYYNFPLFDRVADYLRKCCHDVVNPADIDRDNGFDPMTLPESYDWNSVPEELDLDTVIRRDVDALLSCDGIVMLPYWSFSTGATAEFHLAKWAGKALLYWDADIQIIWPLGTE